MQDLAIDSQQPNSVRMRRRDELTVISRAFRSRNELKNRRGRNRKLLSIQHGLGEIRNWRLPLQRLTTVVVPIRAARSGTPNATESARSTQGFAQAASAAAESGDAM